MHASKPISHSVIHTEKVHAPMQRGRGVTPNLTRVMRVQLRALSDSSALRTCMEGMQRVHARLQTPKLRSSRAV